MAFFNDISKKISGASQSVAQKGKEMTDSIRINALILEEDKKLSALYATIGKQYISLYKGEYKDEIEAYIKEVNESLHKIDELKAQLLEVKSTVKCNSCGAENPKTAQFCATCGNVLKKEESSNVRHCKNCGVQLSEGQRFCVSCGQIIEENKGE